MAGAAWGMAGAALASLVLAVGCGGNTSVSGTGGSAGSGGSAGTGGTAGSGGSAGTGGVAGSGGSSGTGGSGGSGGSSGGTLSASITQSQISVGCMPVVPADPVGGSFDVLYDNQNGTQSASATITSARFVMKSGNNTLTWSFGVTPTGSGAVAVGQTKSVTHTKTAGSGTGQGPQTPCSYCGGTGTLEVTWQSGGKSFSASSQPANILCAM